MDRGRRHSREIGRARWTWLFLAAAILAAAVVAAGGATASSRGGARPVAAITSGSPANLQGLHKIRHVIVIMQENRSFDSYFGTYPGADGLPAAHGRFTVCLPDPMRHRCDYPYHDSAPVNGGAMHTPVSAYADINHGKMNGFVANAERIGHSARVDVMGYHDAREIPNYWTYAHDYVLQDHMFEPVLA